MDLSLRALHGRPAAAHHRADRRLVLGAEPPLTPRAVRRRLHGALDPDVVDAETAERLDAMVAPYGERRPGLRSAPLWTEPLTLYVAKHHDLAGRPGITADELGQARLVASGGWTAAMLTGLGVSPAQIHYAPSWRDAAALVAEGFGVALAGPSCAETFGSGVLARRLDGWLTYCVYWPEGCETAGLRRLLEYPHGEG